MTNHSTRRTVLVTGAAVLMAGCSNYGSGGRSSSSATPPTSSDAPGGQELAKTSEIPVGGGKVFAEQNVVVTQPTKGDFKAFSAICTHQGCTVNAVADGTIDCACHGSKYHIADASVAHGPATRPLPAEQITVKGDSIRLG
ncbi:Rieske (2Fe-2S) protein [Streptomyces sp. NPDC001795]|uniref:Rieske (2Fe-2S) protein n=1 Tax=unclassified Streptomyces TaxID=2593676 RepID=UPI00332E788A